jgi:predicted ATPase/class 3 adenylate cyclase
MGRSLPSGLVTFLFTDIEGSTRLWERDAAVMGRALARHNAILGGAIAAAGGVHFKTIGDAFQAAFPDADSAVAAAIAAQRALAGEAWPETGPIRVRMAVHQGEAKPDASGDYLAPCLNRLARLLSTGFGGQVLLSERVARAVADALPEAVTLRALGRHRLRDLLEPEEVTQLVIAGLPDTFPPLKSLEGHPTNLPVLPTALLGRERELDELATLLGGDDRLLSLTGPGGVGKTHLALQAAADALDRFEDGVWLVPLGEIGSEELLLPRLADVLGVREGGGLDLGEALFAYLAPKRTLLILDNFEQIVAAAPFAAELLGRCPRLRLLVTSRQPLGIAGERLFPVEPLPAPMSGGSPEAARGNPAVRLFAERAASLTPGFALSDGDVAIVADICRRLDALPLAIELAAAQTRHFTLPELLHALHDRFRLLGGGRRDALSHQQTLAATIAWSYDQLDAAPQRVFRALSVFAGGWNRDAAEAVAGRSEAATPVTSVLAALSERSLLRRAGDGAESRWTMLESLREYGLRRLAEAGEEDAARERHADWCLDFATTTTTALAEHDQVGWLAALAREHDNERAALTWCEAAGRRERLLALAAALAPFWQLRGHLSAGRRWLETALVTAEEHPDRLAAMIDAGILAKMQEDNAAAGRWFTRALELARRAGDRGREAALRNNLGAVAISRGELGEAERQFAEGLALAEAIGDRRRRADLLGNLGALAHYRGDVDGALTRYAAALAVWRELNDVHGIAEMLLNVVRLLAPYPEHAARARAAGDEALRRARELGNPGGEAIALSCLGLLAVTTGELERAEAMFAQSLALFRELEDRGGEASVLGSLGLVALERGDLAGARARLEDALRLAAELDDPHALAAHLDGLAALRLAEGDAAGAARLYGAVAALRERTGLARSPLMHSRFVANRALLEARLGVALGAAWAEGHALSREEAVATALGAGPGEVAASPAAALRSLDSLLGLTP